jgi:general secretion pathway protein N
MVSRPRDLSSLLVAAGWLALGLTPELHAATSGTIDILSDDRAGDASNSVEVGTVKRLVAPSPPVLKPLPSGNPLWAVPLSSLTTTQERPIFSASRRPPPRAVAAPVVERSAPPLRPAEPERPMLALIGAVVGDTDAIAVLFDRTTQKIVRLRTGETHAGWQLSAIQAREVTFKKADRTEVLSIQRQEATPAAAPAMPVSQPVVGNVGSYAPFVPRSTPKNGESDGL